MQPSVPAGLTAPPGRARERHSTSRRFGGCRRKNAPYSKSRCQTPAFAGALTKRHSPERVVSCGPAAGLWAGLGYNPFRVDEGKGTSFPRVAHCSQPWLADGIPLGFVFLIRLVGNAQATAGKPRPLLCLFSRKQRGTRNRAGGVSV